MFKLLRSRAKFFYWIIASSFILFTFVVWGAQCNQAPRVQDNNVQAIGSINGSEISYQEWDNWYRNQLAQLRQQNQGRPLTANQRAQAADNVWNSILRTKIQDLAVADRGFKTSDSEVLDILKNNPPMEILNQYRNQEGQIDMDAYLADLADPARDWTQIEAFIRQYIPMQKLMDELTAGVTVTEEELRIAYAELNGRALAEYVGVPFSDLTLDTEPTQAQIQSYYNSHLDDFAQPEMAIVEIVAFGKDASEQDDLEIKELAIEVRQDILDGTMDFAGAAAIYSEDNTRETGGDLGTFDRNRMVDAFTEAAFSLAVGEISDPVRTQFGYHLIEVLEQTETDGEVTEVHARHILLKVTAGDETLTATYDKAVEFAAEADEAGFSGAAADGAFELVKPEPVRQGWDLPGLRNTVQGNLFAFSAEPGDISRVFENDEVFYVVHMLEMLPAGPSPLSEVEPQVVVQVNRERKAEMARTRLAPAVSAIEAGRSLEEAGSEFDVTYAVTDTFTYSGNVLNVGYKTDFNVSARETDIGGFVSDIETTRGVFALRVLWKSDFDEEAYQAARAGLETRLMNQQQQEIIEEWFEVQLAEADIEDNRAVLYGNR